MFGRLWRFAALVFGSLLLSHELVYMLAHGSVGYDQAMGQGGHDRYWTSFAITVIGVCGALTITTARQLRRLGALGAAAKRGSRVVAPGNWQGLASGTLRLWVVVAVVTATTFLVQENAERVLVGQDAPLLGAISGEHALALPVIALVSFLVALVGALVRWRRDLLLARLDAEGSVRPAGAAPALRPDSAHMGLPAASVAAHGLRAPPASGFALT